MFDALRCPVAGCGNARARSQAFCKSHWHALPKPMRDAIWQTYKGGRSQRRAHIANLLEARSYLQGADGAAPKETTNE